MLVERAHPARAGLIGARRRCLLRETARGFKVAEAEGTFSRARVEAFSDGVIAVIITIMVLDLKAPASAAPQALAALWPAFVIYVVSFAFVAIYWINHHALFTLAKSVDAGLIWANNLLLMCLSLIPFATAYVAETDLAPFPTAVYGALQFACGASYFLCFEAIARARRADAGYAPIAKGQRRKNVFSLAVYAVATALALVSPFAAIGLFALIGLLYVVPTLFR